MSIKPTDSIIGPSRGTPDGWFPFIDRSTHIARKDDAKQWIRDTYAVNEPDDMPDAAIVTGQGFEETGNFTNRWFNERLNAGSLGVTGDPAQNEASPTFKTTMASARAMSAHVLLYATGKIDRGGLKPADDPRYTAYRDFYGLSAYPVLSDLSGRYAADKGYGQKIADRANEIYPGLPDQDDVTSKPSEGEPPVADAITFGRVPHPQYQDRQIWKAEGVGMNNLGKRSVKGVTYHRILGSLWSTDTYFRLPATRALTDYGVGTVAQDGSAHDGEILRWNDPRGFQSGWASGTFSDAAYGDGLQFVDKYGVNAINRDRASIEISGFQDTALSETAEDAIAALSAYWADQYGIPWDVYPIAPQDGFSFVVWHEEFGPDEGTKKCPFDVVKALTQPIIEKTRAILKARQTGASDHPVTPDGTIYAAPVTYPWLAKEEAAKGLDRRINKTNVFYLPQVYTAVNETPRRQATGANRKVIGPPIEPGVRFAADYVYRSGGATYVLTRYGTRVKAADLEPKVQVSAKGGISVRKTAASEPDIARKADAA